MNKSDYLKKKINDYLDTENVNDKKILLLIGENGSGKTTFMKKFLKEREIKNNFSKVDIFVSLLGLKTIDDVKTAINNEISSDEKMKKLLTDFVPFLDNFAMRVFNCGGGRLHLPKWRPRDIVDTQAQKQLKRILFIIDDFEECDNVLKKDIIGLFSLIINSGFKIIIIVQNDELLYVKKEMFNEWIEIIFEPLHLPLFE